MVTIDQPKKSHNGPVPYPTMHHFVTEMCTLLLQNGALWNTGLVHCGICATGLLQHVHSPGYGCNHCPLHWYLFNFTVLTCTTHFEGVKDKIILVQYFNSLVPRRRGHYFKCVIFLNSCHRQISWVFPFHLPSHECHRTLVKISQNWFRYWLGAIQKQAITEPVYTKIYVAVVCHLAPIG